MYKKTVTVNEDDAKRILELNDNFTNDKDWLHNRRHVTDAIYWELRRLYDRYLNLDYGMFNRDPFRKEMAENKDYAKSQAGRSFILSYTLRWLVDMPAEIDEDYMFRCFSSRDAFRDIVKAIYKK